jgi:hypothetical protein
VGTPSVGRRKARGSGQGQLSIEDDGKEDESPHGWKSTTAEDTQLGLLYIVSDYYVL